MSIHKIAADFLKEIERGNSPFYKEEQVEVEPVASITGLVALKRPTQPPYFYGFKLSGRPIFTHDLRLAKSFQTSHPLLTEHITHLTKMGEQISEYPTVWINGKHHTA